MIELSNIRKVFNAGKSNEFVAVNKVNLVIDSHRVTGLRGPSGSGKTTLLSLLGCMTRPTSGRIFLSGEEITSLPERFLTEIRRKEFGFIFQQFNLIKGLTALENVMVPAYPGGEKHGQIKKRALELLGLLNLAPKAESKVEWLSGGEAQRVGIARALINGPSIIVADEPTAHLDSRLSAEFMDIIRILKEQGKTVVVASHDPIVFRSNVVDRLVDMRDGQVVAPELTE